VEYNRSIEVLSGYRGRKLDVETRRRFMDCFLKSVGNTAQGMLKLPVPDNMQVVQLTSEAMQMDGEDEFKQRGKNLRRRGIALYNLGQWAMAAQDLRDAMATDKAFASDKVRAAAAAARQQGLGRRGGIVGADAAAPPAASMCAGFCNACALGQWVAYACAPSVCTNSSPAPPLHCSSPARRTRRPATRRRRRRPRRRRRGRAPSPR
jgi:hypothetical protein